MTLTGGSDSKVKTFIRLLCDPSVKDEDDHLLVYEGKEPGEKKGEQVFMFAMSSHEACDKKGTVPEGGFDLVWFLLFPGVLGFTMIFVMIGLVVYFIVGIIINKKRYDRAGVELIPHHEFWLSLPGLVKDGVLFIVSGCGRCVKGRGNSKYSDLDGM